MPILPLPLIFAAPHKIEVLSAKPAPEIDALFQRADGWIGGDGAFSVSLPKGRVVWLFSDTWIGKIREGKRTDSTMVNNTIGAQSSPFAPVEYSIRRDERDKAQSQITPADGRSWFWLQAGGYADGKLYQFLNQVEKTSDPGVFGFRSMGLSLAVTGNPTEPPSRWLTRQSKLTNVIFETDRTVTWGSSLLIDGKTAFIYGTSDVRRGRFLDRRLLLARAPGSSLANQASWEYFDGKAWTKDFRAAGSIAEEVATEHSVNRFGRGNLLVYTRNGLSPEVMARYADRPWGPWSEATKIYACPEMASIPKAFTYAAKAHASLGKGDEIVFSYVVNSTDFWEVARDATLYWPRFVRVRLRLS